MPFTFLDVVLVAIFLLGIFAGAGQGLVRQVFSLAGLVFGVVLASQRYQDVAGLLGWLNNPDGERILSFALITLGVLIAATVVGGIVHKALGFMGFGCLDWLGGGLVGAGTTLFLVDLALVLAIKFPILGLPEAIRGARIPVEVFRLTPAVLAFLPPEFEAVRRFFQ